MDEQIIKAAFGKLQDARTDFLQGLSARMEGVLEAFDTSRRGGHPALLLSGVHRRVVSLNASAGVFGLKAFQGRLRDTAFILDRVLASGLDRAEAGWERKVQSALAELKQQSQDPEGREGFRDYLKEIWGADTSLETTSLVVLLQTGKDPFLDAVAQGVEKRGDRLLRVASLQEMERVVLETKPTVMVVKLEDLGEGTAPLYEMFTRHHATPCHLFFIANDDGFHSRLQSGRQGGGGFFLQAHGPEVLLDGMYAFLETENRQSIKVLVVEESRDLAEYATMLLYGSGMRVGLVASPMEIRPSLFRFQPDLILMDLDMACCSGLELARIIREEPGFSHTPILFLSGDALAFNRNHVAHWGANHLLAKPVPPIKLLRTVSFLYQQSVLARKKGDSDPLTGHLTRDAYLERIEQELSRSRRTQSPFTLVVIEFKTFGSNQNERTEMLAPLQRFGEVIKKTLRTTDVICRLEDSIYSALFMDSDQVGAQRGMEKLQKDWEESCRDAGFSADMASLKSGGASFPAFTKSRAMLRAAEAALNSAKLKGGMQTVFASS